MTKSTGKRKRGTSAPKRPQPDDAKPRTPLKRERVTIVNGVRMVDWDASQEMMDLADEMDGRDEPLVISTETGEQIRPKKEPT
jgi:hypothetical protein